MLADKIKDKSVQVGIIGIGYVGLPLARSFAEAGVRTVGFDLSQAKVDALNKGVSYIPDVPSAAVQDLVWQKKTLRASTDFDGLSEMDVIFICVPTPFDKHKAPDLTCVRSAAESVAKTLRSGQLIVLQSTTYPGTTEEVVQPILEKTGRQAGRDFYLAFSPERIDPGNKKFNAQNTPKVVGGIDKESTRLTANLFRTFIDADKVQEVSCPKTAEMCKILENTFRAVNIALVNEMLMLSERMGIDIWEVVEAASTKPFGFMPFYPGPGVGGHCIAVDPFYLSWKAREYDFFTRFIELAADTNMNMPYYVIDRLRRLVQNLKGARILVLGAAFKKDIDDCRNSVALYLIKLLEDAGAEVVYNDPFVPRFKFDHELYATDKNPREYVSQELTAELLSGMDCVLVAVAHSAYDFDFILRHAKLVFDLVNGARGRQAPNLRKL
ncbi:UDP-N-acetyl-D-glucosamine dehydrogenase [Candidatus Termititenax persephonae]|uniref:UDP-N-acetyl-D-glucosamine dehydrogenase n=1 Tax=Candidatus Termititenax persephonae TaxID=2218525 RepID=A0A388TIL3_9BACT|nr:UDP-N-acetyl-D-glucosamine dehydrogenase [Candidatus Termititenax persephonae]